MLAVRYLQSLPKNGTLQFADMPDGVEQAAVLLAMKERDEHITWAAAQLQGLVIPIAPEEFVPTVEALKVSDVVMA